MTRFGKRLYLHTVRTITGPLFVPGLLAAWLASRRLLNRSVARRLSIRAGTGPGHISVHVHGPPTIVSNAIAKVAEWELNDGTPAPQPLTAGTMPDTYEVRDLRLAVVADTHTENDGAADLHQAVAHLNPDGILHLGDYSNEGGLFETLRHLANWDLLHQTTHCGMLHVLGNHDKRTLGRQWFQELFGPAMITLQIGGWRFIFLDNTEKNGMFSAEHVAALKYHSEIVAPCPTILCFHKPPQCERWPHHAAPERVTELFQAARAAGVKLALCGHCHVYDETEIEGVRVVLTGGGSLPGSDLGFGAPGRHILELTLPTDITTPPSLRKIPLTPTPPAANPAPV